MKTRQGQKRQILIAGCGAIGSVFACLLRESGHDVSILARPRLVEAVRRSGLVVEGIWGEHRAGGIEATSDASDLGGAYDGVLLTCKSFDTTALLGAIGDRAGSRGVAVSLQNGLGNFERVAEVYGAERTLAGRVIFGAEISQPGRTRVTVEAEPVLLGSVVATGSQAAEWAMVFDRAGIACRATDDILAALWGKVLYNAALNPLGALLGLSYGELADSEERREVMNAVIDEAFAVACAEGVALSWPDAGAYRQAFYQRLVPATAGHRSSMLQDLERGHETEIEAICGEVCRRGRLYGIDTPLNRLLTLLVRQRSQMAGRERGESHDC